MSAEGERRQPHQPHYGFAVALNTRAALLARDLIGFRRQLDAAMESAPLDQAHVTLRVSDEAFAIAAAKRAYRAAGAPYGEGDAALLRWAVEAERIGVRW